MRPYAQRTTHALCNRETATALSGATEALGTCSACEMREFYRFFTATKDVMCDIAWIPFVTPSTPWWNRSIRQGPREAGCAGFWVIELHLVRVAPQLRARSLERGRVISSEVRHRAAKGIGFRRNFEVQCSADPGREGSLSALASAMRRCGYGRSMVFRSRSCSAGSIALKARIMRARRSESA